MYCNDGLIIYMAYYSKKHNTGASQNMGDQDVMLFKPFDWTMVYLNLITFDWLLKYIPHARSIWVHLACSFVMVFAVMLFEKQKS